MRRPARPLLLLCERAAFAILALIVCLAVKFAIDWIAAEPHRPVLIMNLARTVNP